MINEIVGKVELSNVLTFLSGDEVDLADEAVDAGAHVGVHVEERTQEAQVHQFMLALEILAVVPLDNRVLKLTDTVRIAVDLEDAVLHSAELAVVAVRQDGVLGGLGEDRREPLNGVDVDHALHVEEVQRNLDGVALANLVDRLDVWPID